MMHNQLEGLPSNNVADIVTSALKPRRKTKNCLNILGGNML